MITLACTKCDTTMNVDDGFAGGVCRCCRCGTIQTVPASTGGDAPTPRHTGTSIWERASNATGRTLPAATSPAPLPEVPGDSGATINVTRASRSAAPVAAQASVSHWLGIGVVCVAGLAALGVAYATWYSLERSTSPPEGFIATQPAPGGPSHALPAGPSFGPIRLDGVGPVVFLIDCADPSKAFAPQVARLVEASIESIGSGRSVQVRCWTAAHGSEVPTLPAAPTAAGAAGIGDVGSWLSSSPQQETTDAVASLERALETQPGEVVLVTGKGWQLAPTDGARMVALTRGKSVRVHCVSLGTTDVQGPLAVLAEQTGGERVALTSEDLARLIATLSQTEPARIP